MIPKILCVVLIICGLIMIFAGLFGWQEVSVPHILFGIIAVAAGFIVMAHTAPFYDDRTGRYYHVVSKYNSPSHAPCPMVKCGQLSPLIHTVYRKPKMYGVLCPIHGKVWCDFVGPITISELGYGEM